MVYVKNLIFLLIFLVMFINNSYAASVIAFEPIEEISLFQLSMSNTPNFLGDIRDLFFLPVGFFGNVSSQSQYYSSLVANQGNQIIFLHNVCVGENLLSLVLASQISAYYGLSNLNHWNSSDALAIVNLSNLDIHLNIPLTYRVTCIDHYTTSNGVISDAGQLGFIPISTFPPSGSVGGVEIQINFLTSNPLIIYVTTSPAPSTTVTRLEVLHIPGYGTPTQVYTQTNCQNNSCNQAIIQTQPNQLYEFLSCNSNNICDIRMITT